MKATYEDGRVILTPKSHYAKTKIKKIEDYIKNNKVNFNLDTGMQVNTILIEMCLNENMSIEDGQKIYYGNGK